MGLKKRKLGDDATLLGDQMRKLHPKLRMFARADDEVNFERSSFASAMVHFDASAIEGHGAEDEERTHQSRIRRKLDKEPQKSLSENVAVNTFVWNINGDLKCEQLRLNAITERAAQPDVALIELGEPLKLPDVEIRLSEPPVPQASERNVPGRDLGGKDVLIGIIDVGGFDFSHSDFLKDNGETRWIRIWDQGENGLRPPPSQGVDGHTFQGLDYGSELTSDMMNEAIRDSRTENLPAFSLEPQTQMSLSSHGTHVASIAAGNRGVCRNSPIAGVLIDVPIEEARDRRKSFYDSTRIVAAVDYLTKLADSLNLKLSINISLGTNGGGHDASNGASRMIDHLLAMPGRSVCVAAGNAGQEAPAEPGDFGFVMGRIHSSGQIAARGLTQDIDWIVAGEAHKTVTDDGEEIFTQVADVSENELEIWYSGSDRFSITVTPPGMDPIGPISPQQYMQNAMLSDGSMLSIYNELYHPANGANYIAVYLSPFFVPGEPVVGVRPGQWKITLHGDEIRAGHYHAWIERDDPRRLGILEDKQAWNFPSFFSERSNVDNSSVSSLACGQRVVSVANFDQAENAINITSSEGPTRDGRAKPDVAAPGTDIVAANGFYGDGDSPWVSMTGTSMASPYVCGVAGLMLEAAENLTAAQICGIIQRTSQPLPGATYEWAKDAGYGVLDGAACVAEARNLSSREKVDP